MNEFNVKSIRLEFDSFQGLEDGIVLPMSKIAAASIIETAFKSDIPVLVVDDNNEILFRLHQQEENQIKAVSQSS